MNSTFKVVFNKARGALMVVNEVTSSVQAKGTKTVIAAAVASLIAGGAMAADKTWEELAAQTEWDKAGTTAATIPGGAVLQAEDVVNAEGKTLKIAGVSTSGMYNETTQYGVLGTGSVTNEGLIYATATKLTGGIDVVGMAAARNGTADTITNKGEIYAKGTNIKEAAGGEWMRVTGMGGLAGDTIVNQGLIKVEGDDYTEAYGIATWSDASSTEATTVTNKGRIEVAGKNGMGVNLGSGNDVFENRATGTITATNGASGVVLADNGTITNKGTINAGEGNAIVVEDAVETGSITLVEGSTTIGNIVIGGDDSLTSGSGAITIDVEADATVTGSILVNEANTVGVDLEDGAVINGGLTAADGTTTITVEESGAAAFTGDLVIDGAEVVTAGGALSVGNITADGTASLAVGSEVSAAALNVVGYIDEEDASQNVQLTLSGEGSLAVEGAVTVGGEKASEAAAAPSGTGTLVVNMTAPAAEDEFNLEAGSLSVGNLGTARLTAGKIKVGAFDVAKGGKVEGAATIVADSLDLVKGADFANTGSVTVGKLTNAAEENKASFATLQVKEGTNDGWLAATNLTFKGGTFTNNAVVSEEEATAGKILNQLKATTLLKVDNGTLVNNGIVNAAALTLDDGAVYQSALVLADSTDDTKTLRGDKIANFANTTVTGLTTVGEDSVFVIEGLNDWIKAPAEAADKKTKAFDKLTLNGAWTLDGGYIKVGESTLEGQTVAINNTFNVADREDFKVGTVVLGAAGALTLGDALDAYEYTKAEIGTLDATTGTVTLNGDLTVTTKLVTPGTNVSVGTDGELTVDATVIGMSVKEGATLDANVFEFAKDEGATNPFFQGLKKNDGIVNVNGLKGTVKYDKIANSGVIATAGSNDGLIYLNGLTVDLTGFVNEETGKITATQANGLGGVVTDATRVLTVTSDANNTNLRGEFAKVEFTADGADTVTAKNILKLNADGNIVETKAGKAGNIAIDTGATFIYAGAAEGDGGVIGKVEGTNGSFGVESGKLTASGVVSVNKLAVEGTLVAEKTVTTFADAVVAGTLNATGAVTVGNDLLVSGAVDAKDDVTVTGDIDVNGTMTVAASKLVDDETVDVTLDINGGVVSGKLEALGDVVIDDELKVLDGVANLGSVTGDITVGNGDPEASAGGTLFVKKLVDGSIYADPAFTNGVVAVEDASKVYVETITAAGKVQAGSASIVAVGTQNVADVSSALEAAGFTGFEEEGDVAAVLYLSGAKQIEGGVLADGGEDLAGAFGNGVEAATNTLTIVDAKTFTADTVLAAEDLDVELLGDVYIANAEHGQTLTFVSGEGEFHADTVRTGFDRILGVKINNGENGGLAVAVKEGNDLGLLANAVTVGTIQEYFKGNKSGNKFIEDMMNTAINPDDAKVVTALNDVAGIGASAGMASVTMDALSAFNDTVAQRTSILAPNAEGTTVWADVNGGRYEAKKLFNGAGYSSDIYAGVLGVDTVVACGAKIGAALTVGTGDTDSKNTTAVTSMDSDFFGISVYTSKTFGDVANVAIDLGYMQGSNDVSVKAYDLGKFSADSDAFTLGIRGELLTKAGSFNVVPHAGLRWTRISVDSFEAGYTTDIDNMNVFQLPVGVTVSGEFEGAGFTWAPAFDLSFVPAFGDKDADMTLGIAGSKAAATSYGVQVIDSNPVQATLGIDATNGAWAFGLNYKLGVGTDSRMNNSFNANVRYTF